MKFIKGLASVLIDKGVLGLFIGLSLIIASFGGWFANIVKFCYMLDGGFTAMFAARIVGFFFFPLGMALGYF